MPVSNFQTLLSHALFNLKWLFWTKLIAILNSLSVINKWLAQLPFLATIRNDVFGKDNWKYLKIEEGCVVLKNKNNPKTAWVMTS